MDEQKSLTRLRTRWAAIGAAIAITLGASTITTVNAVTSSGERAVYNPITACRLTDTRLATQVGPRSTPLSADETLTIAARGTQGECTATDLPNDATALALNVTALLATERTFFTFWPDGTRPNAASLNPAANQPPTPNAVTVPLSNTGNFNLYNLRGNVHVVIDVVGFYTDHNHDDRYPSKTQRVVIPAASFSPSTISGSDSVRPSFSRSTISGAYFSGGNSLNGANQIAVAPLDLPVGTRITSLSYHYVDNSTLLLGAIEFSINRTSLTSNSQGTVPNSFFKSGGANSSPRSSTVTPDYVIVAGETLHLAVVVRTVWPGVGPNLSIKGVEIEYDLP